MASAICVWFWQAVQLGYRKLITFSCSTSECVPLWSADFTYDFDFLAETVFLWNNDVLKVLCFACHSVKPEISGDTLYIMDRFPAQEEIRQGLQDIKSLPPHEISFLCASRIWQELWGTGFCSRYQRRLFSKYLQLTFICAWEIIEFLY